MPEIVGAVVAAVAFVAFRYYAARQVAARRGVFVWARAFPLFLVPAAIIWAGVRLLSTAQILGGVLVLFGAVLGVGVLVFFRRASRAISSLAQEDDLNEAIVAQTTDYMLLGTVITVVSGIVIGVAAVVLAILNYGH
jgi:hypothetical protein